MIVARQSTARTVTVGPVLDADGVAVTGGVVADFKIAKNGGAPAALNGSATLTHRHTGFYSLALTASDLDTVGQAEVTIDDTTNCCPIKELTVIEEAVYDSLFAASATGYQIPIWSSAGATVNLSATTVATVTTTTTATNVTTVNGLAANVITATSIAADAITAAKIADNAIDAGSIASDAITAAKIATGAITAAKFAAGAIDAAALAADAGTEIGTAVWATAARTLTAGTNIQLPSNGLANVTAWTVNITGTVSGNVGGIASGGITTASFAAGAINAAAIATGAIDADALATDAVTEIVTAVWTEALPGAYGAGTAGHIVGTALPDVAFNSNGGLPIVDGSGNVQANVVAIGGNSDTPVQLVIMGQDYADTIFDGGIYTGVWASATRTLTALPTIPADWLTASGLAASATAEIADAVWDEAIAGHLGAGSTGAALNAAGSAGDPWTTPLPGAYGSGTAGFIIGTNLNATITSRMATYTQPTGFLAATFPTTVASTTNITAGTITTATNVTTVNGLAANVITAAATASDFGTEIGTAVWANGTRTLTSLSGLTVDTVTTLTNLPAITANWLTAAGTAADFGTEVATAVTTAIGTGSALTALATQASVNTIDDLLDTELPALTTAVDALPTNAELATALGTADDATLAAIAALNNLSSAQAQTAAAAALTAYDPPTRTEATADKDELLAQLPSSPVKNSAFTYVIKMVDSTDHSTPETGLTITATRSIDGAAFGAATGVVSEISTGHYKFVASAADMNGDVVAHKFAATGADDLTIVMKTVS